MTGIIGGTFLGGASVAAFAAADVPVAAFATAAAFSVLGLLGAWVRIRGYFRSRRFPPPPLTGWRLAVAAVWAGACTLMSLAMALLGSAAGSAVFGAGGAGFALWCAVSAREGCPQWTDRELAALADEADLEELLDAMPVTTRERRLR